MPVMASIVRARGCGDSLQGPKYF